MRSEELKTRLLKEEIVLDEVTVLKLERFAALLHEWNGIHNLTGAKNIDAIYDNIIDSLYPLTFIEKPRTLLDVGTGAGFPGLVLAIALPQTQVVLAEPLKKRVSFLKYAAIDLELSNVTVEAKRVEKVVHEPFELISSRAVTNTRLLLDLAENISNEKTAYLFYKGSRVFDEVADVQHQLDYDIVQKSQRNYLYIKGKV
ncbi:16S rRNA (guanine(527)-N(7))-methyltransferase RsmG [Sulfurovum sp.]|uniref:16S rRNA (guanine(527)-N(7))-methyltransferase RsmG n=1 Tax=Sulfurovum sp. TaxID=1969726 RepID=UPI0025E0056A|nr:16S rRNA (guanine(527)-N(7))-methyltransferase RsmG [Sulfurovum sp.]